MGLKPEQDSAQYTPHNFLGAHPAFEVAELRNLKSSPPRFRGFPFHSHPASSDGDGDGDTTAATHRGGGGRRAATGGTPSPAKRPRHSDDSASGTGGESDSDSDGDLVSDLREIVCLLRLIKGGANKDGQKICEQIVSSVAADIQTMLEETQLKFEEERQNLLKVLSNTSKECQSSLNEEYSKFQETYATFCKEKDAHMQTFRDLFSKVEVEKKKLLEKYEHHRKAETNTLSDLDKTLSEKVTHAEQSVRRVKQDDKSFIIFRKSIGSFVECASDDDFDLDE